jgi:hypothetical protein
MRANDFKNKKVKYIILTREDRFDLYGKNADILLPLNIEGDYKTKFPDCFRLVGFSPDRYSKLVSKFYNQYKGQYNILRHVYPKVTKPAFQNKYQFHKSKLKYDYVPRQENYDLVNLYIPNDGKPLVVLAPRFRKGFKRNWNKWDQFYDLLVKQHELIRNFNFIICGKPGEYIPDKKSRFLDMNEIKLGDKSSKVGLLLAIMERTFFVYGSQSAIPNIALLYNVDVLSFGCQKRLHTKTYNIRNTPITFIDNKKYDIDPQFMLEKLSKLLNKKRGRK